MRNARDIHDISRTPANVYLSGWRYHASLIFNSVRPRHKATLAMRAYAHIGFGVSCETRYQTQSSPRNPWYLVLAKFAKPKAKRYGDRHGDSPPEVNSRKWRCTRWHLTSLAARFARDEITVLALAYAVGYACLYRHASERASAIIPPGASAGSRQGIIRLIAAAHRVLDGLRSAKCDVLASNRARFISIALISYDLYLLYLRFSLYWIKTRFYRLHSFTCPDCRRPRAVLLQIIKYRNYIKEIKKQRQNDINR